MKKVSRRDMLKVSVPTVACTLLGTPMVGSAMNRNEAESTQKLKIIVFGAHPDDPETGCGGTIALLANEGHEVISAYLTRGEAGIKGVSYDEAAKIRTAEALEACKILNTTPKFLGQIDGNCEVTKEHYKAVSEFLEEEKPDIVFNQWPIDRHRDHRACSILVYDAWYNHGRESVMYYYEVMSGRQSQNFSPSNYVDITSTIEQKHKACNAHKSQKPDDWYQESHGQMEIFRGLEFNTKYAEGFIRHVQSPNRHII
uniref:PIG-L deacetylase family protein n=1 Tax=uncultured Draconibacterium sp. TaxID=1573823 RepID=UPI00321672A4